MSKTAAVVLDELPKPLSSYKANPNNLRIQVEGFLFSELVYDLDDGVPIEACLESKIWLSCAKLIKYRDKIEVWTRDCATIASLRVIGYDGGRDYVQVHLTDKQDVAPPDMAPYSYGDFRGEWSGPLSG